MHVGTPRKRSTPRTAWRWLRRRAAIEPVIGHLKGDHRMDRNLLKGEDGDRINALLAACGYNLRKLLRAFLALILGWLVAAGEAWKLPPVPDTTTGPQPSGC